MNLNRFTVSQKIAGLIVVILLVSFVFNVVLIYPRFRKNSIHRSRSVLEETARGVAGNIDSVLKQSRRELERIARHPNLESMESRRIDEVLLTVDMTTANFLSMFVLNNDGIVISRPDKPQRVGVDRSHMAIFKEPRSAGDTVFSDFFISPAGNLTTTMSTPVRGPDGSMRGVLVGSLGVDERNINLFRVVTDVNLGTGGYAYLVDRAGNLIAHSRGRKLSDEYSNLKLDNLSHVRELMAGRQGSEVLSHDGEAWIVGFSPVPSSGWGVVVQQPIAEIPNFAAAMVTYTLSILAAVIIIGSFMSILFVKRLLRPLELLAKNSGAQMEEEEQDEIGDEILILSGRIAKMFEQIRRSESELHKINLELEEEVAQRNLVEDDLSFNLAILDTQLERSPDGVLVVDTDKRIILSNRRYRDMWNLPEEIFETRSYERILEFTKEKVVDPEGFMERIRYLYENLEEQSWDQIPLKDGRVLDRYSEPMTGPEGVYYGRVCYFRDVTRQVISEDEMRSSLREKETLLKEVHHRVKNNLQAMSGILDLQSAYIKDEQIVNLFRISRSRIHTMALLHEKLYQGEDQTRVNLRDYITDLTSYLVNTMQTEGKTVRINTFIDEITLNLDTTVPCGLIVTELVSNALKYGYPEGRSGEVRVEITRAEGKSYRLIVSDDGIGLPEDLDFENLPSLGLQLVNALVQQLSGTLDVSLDEGTTYKILFREYSEYKGVL